MNLEDRIQNIILENYSLFKNDIEGKPFERIAIAMVIREQVKRLIERLKREVMEGVVNVKCPYCGTLFTNDMQDEVDNKK